MLCCSFWPGHFCKRDF